MKWIKILILLIVITSLVVPLPHASADEPILQVKLENFIGNTDKLSIKINGRYQIKEYPELALLADEVYSIKVENNRLALYQGDSLIQQAEGTITIPPILYQADEYITLNNRRYLGEIEFTIENNQFVRPINRLPLEDYLK